MIVRREAIEPGVGFTVRILRCARFSGNFDGGIWNLGVMAGAAWLIDNAKHWHPLGRDLIADIKRHDFDLGSHTDKAFRDAIEVGFPLVFWELADSHRCAPLHGFD